MRKPSRAEVLTVLRERSTLTGIAGLVVVLTGLFGFKFDAEIITELMLILVSVVAIVTRPEHRHGNGDSVAGSDPGTRRGGGAAGAEDEKRCDSQRSTQERADAK